MALTRMAAKDVTFWKERLRFADQIWDEHGLGENTPTEMISTLATLNAYRNITWGDEWGGLQHEDLIEVPSGFALVNTLSAQIFARNPIVDVFAQDPDGKQGARVMESLENFLVRNRRLAIKAQINRALLHSLLTPMGVIRHGFTPQEEFSDVTGRRAGRRLQRYLPAKPDFPWIRAVPAWDVRIDPTAETFDPRGDVRWIAFRSLLTMDDVKRTKNLVARDDLRPTRSMDFGFLRKQGKRRSPETDLVEMWTIYEIEEGTWFAISPGSDLPLRERDSWPIEWETLPYNLIAFNPQLDDPFPIPPMQVVRHQIVERNKTRTLMSQLVKRMRRVIAVSKDAVETEDYDRLMAGDADLKEMIGTKGDARAALAEVQLGTFPQELIMWDERLLEDMREALGQSLLTRGQRINVETATEAGAVQQGADLQAGRLAGPFEDALSDVFATYGDALQSPGVLTEEFTIPIVGRVDARQMLTSLGVDPFRAITPQEIQGAFVYEIRPGSTSPRNPAADRADAMANLQVAQLLPQNVNIQQCLVDYFVAVDRDPSQMLLNPQEMQNLQAGMQQAGAEGAPTTAPGPPMPPELFGGGTASGGGQMQ